MLGDGGEADGLLRRFNETCVEIRRIRDRIERQPIARCPLEAKVALHTKRANEIWAAMLDVMENRKP